MWLLFAASVPRVLALSKTLSVRQLPSTVTATPWRRCQLKDTTERAWARLCAFSPCQTLAQSWTLSVTMEWQGDLKA